MDFRKGHDGLAALAERELDLNPHSGIIVVFRAKRGDRIKVTFRYDKNAISRVEAMDVQTGQRLDCSEVSYEEPDLASCVPPRKPRAKSEA